MILSFLGSPSSLALAPFAIHAMLNAQNHVQSEKIIATADAVSGNEFMRRTTVIEYKLGQEARFTNLPVSKSDFSEVLYFKLNGEQAIGIHYQPHTGQYTSADGTASTLDEIIKATAPSFDEFLARLVVKNGLRETLKAHEFYTSDWKTIAKGDQIIVKSSSPASITEFRINRRTARPSQITFGNSTGSIRWAFAYSPLKKVTSPAQEKGAFKVAQFDPTLARAQVSSASAGSTLDRVLARYDQPNGLGYTVTTGRETATVYFSPKFAYQSDSTMEFSYDGSTLSFINKKTRQSYSGPAGRIEVLDVVAATGSRIEPNLRNLIMGINPFRQMINRDAQVKTIGPAKSSEPAEIIEAKTPYAILILTAAKSDGFILKIESTPISPDGDIFPTTTSTFRRIKGSAPQIKIPPTARPAKLDDLK